MSISPALSELMDQYWPTLFPETSRMRARVNALGWLVPRTANQLGAAGPAEAQTVAALSSAAARLAEVTRLKFEDKGPAMGPLLEAIKRLELDARPTAASEATPQKAAAPPLPQNPSVSTSPTSTALPAVGSAEGVTAEGIPEFLRQVGATLVTASATLFRANPLDPLAFRLSRTGLWLQVVDPPPRGTTGSTSVPPLPPNTRAQLERLASNGKWQELLEESESALRQFRFCLDVQHFSAKALAGLGAAPAREALVTALAGLVRRLPTLPRLTNNDGSPFAAASTQAWLEEEVAPSKTGPSSGAGSSESSDPQEIAEARALLQQGQTADAVALLQGALGKVGSARERFVLRLAQARLCAEGGQVPVARGLYAALDQECVARGLDQWEPALAVECLEGLLTHSRIVGKAFPPELAGQYYRLCQLNPAAALRVGSERA